MTLPRSRLILIVSLALFVTLLAITYGVASLQGGQGRLLLPLDDVYIHFQYAKQLALGHPFQYNDLQPPTSGATSFLYPFVLAIGYMLGFTGLNLALWAMLIGGLALFGTLLAVLALLESLDVPHFLKASVLIVVAGCSAWHFFSGMETGLVIFASVATLAALATKHHHWMIVCASLLTLLRPEGGLLAASAVGINLLFQWKTLSRIQRLSLLFPILLIGLQPLVNRIVTGSFVATGNQSKSILATVPQDWGVIIPRVLSNFVRMGSEWLTGYGEHGWYLPPLVGVLAMVSLLILLKRPTRSLALVISSWVLIISGSVSTLDNAFWHFKRYQMPIMVVLVVMSVIVIARFWRFKILAVGVTALFTVAGVFIGVRFLNAFETNVGYVYAQPFQMAEWLRYNTPENAVVAVHDVGLMRYWGERNTLDMVGLTTPDAAGYWRNGVGSVAEFLLANRPDYIASYGRGHGYGLGMLENTALMRDPLVAFTVPIDPTTNVALAGETQSIYQPKWNALTSSGMKSLAMAIYAAPVQTAAHSLNVADLQSELQHNYRWQGTPPNGYLTDIYEQTTLGDPRNQLVLDACRRVTTLETMTFNALADNEAQTVLVSRLHAVGTGTLDIEIGGTVIATRTLINAPGNWQEISTRIPDDYMQSPLTITLRPHLTSGEYCAARHELFYTPFTTYTPFGDTTLALFNHGVFTLNHVDMDAEATAVRWVFHWNVLRETVGDTRMFVHLYDNLDKPPVAQWDGYPLGGLPTGNWLLGGLYDTIDIDTTPLAVGEYTVALGFYDVNTGQRLQVTSETLEVRDNRLILSEKVTVSG